MVTEEDFRRAGGRPGRDQVGKAWQKFCTNEYSSTRKRDGIIFYFIKKCRMSVLIEYAFFP